VLNLGIDHTAGVEYNTPFNTITGNFGKKRCTKENLEERISGDLKKFK